MPSFSIVTPVYNSAQWIDQCVQSVINQSYDNFELILVDDGSNDQSKTICMEYAKKDARIVFIESCHLGVSQSRNIALRHATGKYVLFLDSDDWLDISALENLIAIYNSSMPDFIIFDYVLVQKTGKAIHNKRIMPGKQMVNRSVFIDIYFRKLVEQNYHPYLCDKVYVLDIIKKNNIIFEESISYGEDWLFVVNYCRYVHNAFFSNEKLYYYRRTNTNSLSQRFIPNSFNSVVLWEYSIKQMLVNEYKFSFSQSTYDLFISRILICVLYAFKQEKNILKLYRSEADICSSNITSEILAKSSPIKKNNYLRRILILCVNRKQVLLLSIISILATFYRYFERHGKW